MFMKCIEINDIEGAEEALGKLGDEHFAQNDNLTSPLVHAIVRKRRPMVKLLLEQISAFDDHIISNTYLCAAVESGERNITKIILEKGANPNVLTSEGRALLHSLHTPVEIDMFQRHGANLNITDIGGKTILHYLVMKNRPDTLLLEWLVNRGVDPNTRDLEGNNALHTFALYGNENLSHSRRGSLIQRLLDVGTDPTAQNNDGSTAAQLLNF